MNANPRTSHALDRRLPAEQRVLTLRQLHRHGVPAAVVAERCRPGGPWQQVLPQVSLLHPEPPSGQERLRAALLYAGWDPDAHGSLRGRGAMVTGLAALALYGLPCVPPLQELPRIAVLVAHGVEDAGEVSVRRAAALPRPREAAGLPCAPVPRALADAAARHGRRRGGTAAADRGGARRVLRRRRRRARTGRRGPAGAPADRRGGRRGARRRPHHGRAAALRDGARPAAARPGLERRTAAAGRAVTGRCGRLLARARGGRGDRPAAGPAAEARIRTGRPVQARQWATARQWTTPRRCATPAPWTTSSRSTTIYADPFADAFYTGDSGETWPVGAVFGDDEVWSRCVRQRERLEALGITLVHVTRPNCATPASSRPPWCGPRWWPRRTSSPPPMS